MCVTLKILEKDLLKKGVWGLSHQIFLREDELKFILVIKKYLKNEL